MTLRASTPPLAICGTVDPLPELGAFLTLYVTPAYVSVVSVKPSSTIHLSEAPVIPHIHQPPANRARSCPTQSRVSLDNQTITKTTQIPPFLILPLNNISTHDIPLKEERIKSPTHQSQCPTNKRKVAPSPTNPTRPFIPSIRPRLTASPFLCFSRFIAIKPDGVQVFLPPIQTTMNIPRRAFRKKKKKLTCSSARSSRRHNLPLRETGVRPPFIPDLHPLRPYKSPNPQTNQSN